jgi:hypothetical protein
MADCWHRVAALKSNAAHTNAFLGLVVLIAFLRVDGRADSTRAPLASEDNGAGTETRRPKRGTIFSAAFYLIGSRNQDAVRLPGPLESLYTIFARWTMYSFFGWPVSGNGSEELAQVYFPGRRQEGSSQPTQASAPRLP